MPNNILLDTPFSEQQSLQIFYLGIWARHAITRKKNIITDFYISCAYPITSSRIKVHEFNKCVYKRRNRDLWSFWCILNKY